MMPENRALNLARRLEEILRRTLSCHYTEFEVKANDDLLNDWKSPINFALGYCYAKTNDDPDVKNRITDFLGNDFIGEGINDVIVRFEWHGLKSEEDAYKKIESIIDEVESILKHSTND